ncbi:PEP-CTERM sorting domain-containing protein [Paludisphaera mucosa]|uniref:PEP-CTERM sorting domain-containing protein n=1 Tax=Paludisphaera mucosa TaxID=3030827 RepID=A0ABT6FC07_9BACT|nr:PEP-CTERM sorting domain-containing protein [Paludisphaera mucosa]MDG3005118.1 PEP-CTERM sorting domain-containing protein [Paludisphaera mucosa]
MKSIAIWAAALCVGFGGGAAKAALVVGATISAQQDGSNYDYTIVLTNSAASTVNVGTFWFAWIPGQDYLKTSPSSITSPAGWSSAITHFPDAPTNGYAIQWVAGSGASPDPTKAITPGSSLTFGFTSADAPSEVFGNSTFFNHPSVLTSFVYEGAPFRGESLQFTVAAVPEPSSLALAAFGTLGGAVALRRRRAKAPGSGARVDSINS